MNNNPGDQSNPASAPSETDVQKADDQVVMLIHKLNDIVREGTLKRISVNFKVGDNDIHVEVSA